MQVRQVSQADIAFVTQDIQKLQLPHNKYMKNYKESKESQYVTYPDKNHFNGFAVGQRLSTA